MRNRLRKIFGYPKIEKMSQKEVNMNRSMRRERAGILRRLKGNAALILGKNTAVTFLKECRRLPLDHKYIVDPKLKQKALPTLLEVLQALEECTVGFRLASDREISEILGTEVEEFDYSQKLVGTFIGELRDIFNAWRLDIIRLKQNLRKSAEGDQDKEYVLQIRRRVISDRLKKGSLTPPAIGEGCLYRYNERFLYAQFVLRCERDDCLVFCSSAQPTNFNTQNKYTLLACFRFFLANDHHFKTQNARSRFLPSVKRCTKFVVLTLE